MKRNLYESTVMDTTKVRVAWFVWALPVALVVLGVLLWRVWAFFNPEKPKPAPKPVAPVTARAEPIKGLSLGSGTSTRPNDLVAYFKPRIEGQPWTAPAYDSRPVVSYPEVYCIAVDDGRCSCMTEQGTRYEMDKKICRSIATNGVYNPYRRPADNAQQGQASQANQLQQVPHENANVAGLTGGSTGLAEWRRSAVLHAARFARVVERGRFRQFRQFRQTRIENSAAQVCEHSRLVTQPMYDRMRRFHVKTMC